MLRYIVNLIMLSCLARCCISSSFFHKENDDIKGAGILTKTLKPSFDNNNGKTTNENLSTAKRWQVGRISRKEYEMINMLWTSTNPYKYDTSSDSKLSVITLNKNLSLTTGSLVNNRHIGDVRKYPSTPSYIEFYYLNDNDIIQSEFETKIKFPISNSSQLKSRAGPVLSFRNNDVPLKRSAHSMPKINDNVTCKNVKLCGKVATIKATKPYTKITNSTHTKRTYYFTTVPGKIFATKIMHLKTNKIKIKPTTDDLISSVSYTTKKINKEKYKLLVQVNKNKESTKTSSSPSTNNDKIFFFELYDTNTAPTVKSNVFNATKDVFSEKKSSDNTTLNTSPPTYIPKDYRFLQNGTFLDNKSKAVSWKDYPFVAAYIHEPSNVHCDAASLSQNWLVAAASCLSRHSKDSEGQSPFVTYCGDSWRYPKRITYVKYSIVHPRYQQRDHTRRYLYNIGLIQVVAALSLTCPSWTPVSLMSHDFIAAQEGSSASAVGWGMDRYTPDADAIDKLPGWPLMMYNSVIYSTSCPGSFGYRRVKENIKEKIFKSIYCLALPPYTGEKSDPVHGGLLLTEGKLIALYLKEERRSWGEQSAEYTGIWQHVPWIQETAREPDSTEMFSL